MCIHAGWAKLNGPTFILLVTIERIDLHAPRRRQTADSSWKCNSLYPLCRFPCRKNVLCWYLCKESDANRCSKLSRSSQPDSWQYRYTCIAYTRSLLRFLQLAYNTCPLLCWAAVDFRKNFVIRNGRIWVIGRSGYTTLAYHIWCVSLRKCRNWRFRVSLSSLDNTVVVARRAAQQRDGKPCSYRGLGLQLAGVLTTSDVRCVLFVNRLVC